MFFFTEKILKNISIWNWEKRSKERNIYIEKPAKFLDLRRHLESFASTMHRNRSAHTTWFLSVFFHWIQLLSTVFCYSWLVCLLGFWLRNASLVKVGNPRGWHRFRFSPRLMLKRIEKSEAILGLLDSFQELHLEW